MSVFHWITTCNCTHMVFSWNWSRQYHFHFWLIWMKTTYMHNFDVNLILYNFLDVFMPFHSTQWNTHGTYNMVNILLLICLAKYTKYDGDKYTSTPILFIWVYLFCAFSEKLYSNIVLLLYTILHMYRIINCYEHYLVCLCKKNTEASKHRF